MGCRVARDRTALLKTTTFTERHVHVRTSTYFVPNITSSRSVDLVAERIRALGLPAPGSYKQFIQLSAIQEDDGIPKAQDMIRRLVEGHETVARTSREIFQGAEAANDQPTCDLLTQRMQVHEKTAWMLRSLLE